MLESGPPPPLLFERMDIGVPGDLRVVAGRAGGGGSSRQSGDRRARRQYRRGRRRPTDRGTWSAASRAPARRRRGDHPHGTVRPIAESLRPARTRRRDERAHRQRPPHGCWRRRRSRPKTATCGCWASVGRCRHRDAEAAGRRDSARSAERMAAGASIDAVRPRCLCHRPIAVCARQSGQRPPADPAYARASTILLATQNANGSWRVTSRSPKFQAYFNSGFPYAGDQWISAWATGWATMALAQAAGNDRVIRVIG